MAMLLGELESVFNGYKRHDMFQWVEEAIV